jgi:hypothetical protein
LKEWANPLLGRVDEERQPREDIPDLQELVELHIPETLQELKA